MDAVLLKWLPVSSPQELVVVGRNPTKPSVGFNYPDYEYFRDHNHSFSGILVAGHGGALSMTVPDEGAQGASQLVPATLVSGNYFQVLGVTAAIGRLFTPEDNKTAGAHPIAILSYDFWKNRFASDPRVLGRKVNAQRIALHHHWSIEARLHWSQRGELAERVPANHDAAAGECQRGRLELAPLLVADSVGALEAGRQHPESNRGGGVLYQQIEQNDPERQPTPTYDKERELRNHAVLLPGSGGYSNLRNRFSKRWPCWAR